jgi:oxygen-independent coproporphyrinogen-3 oxidase
VFDASVIEEATAELCPADASQRYVQGLQRMGFDRVHLPVLSFFPEDLAALDAPHSAEDAVHALHLGRKSFDHVSVDLLFGWPEQSMAHWRAALTLAVELGISHLTLTEATAPGVPSATDEALADRLEFAMTFLQSEGYQQYELTHFARPGARSAHQDLYYSHGNYLGLGPSAESFWWTDRDAAAVGTRWANVGDLAEYVSLLDEGASPVAYRETLDATALAREYLLLRLRTIEGADVALLSDRYGYDVCRRRDDLLARLRRDGLLHDDPDALRLTNRGRLVADAVAARLLPSD